MRLLVTGGSGLVGATLLRRVSVTAGVQVRATARSPVPEPLDGVTYTISGEIGPQTDWRSALDGVDRIVHTAARVHLMKDTAPEPLAAFRLVNTAGTLNLARQAAAAGVRRFVFLSSIKVNGEATESGKYYHADDASRPSDAYAISKHEAEAGLFAIGRETGMEIVVIRPPLVYGPGVKANFLSMMRWLHAGIPLPFAAVTNKRSLVALDNLVSFVMTCTVHAAAANQVFLVADGEDLSTTELLRRLGMALGKPARLFFLPPMLLSTAASLCGRRNMLSRLYGSLQIDTAKTRNLLGWVPPLDVDTALQATAEHFLRKLRG